MVRELEETPIDSPSPIRELASEVKLLREQTARVADYAMQAVSKIPALEKKIERLQFWHQWLPTAALVAIAVKLWLHP
jgi:hypothetical protein